jgi:hypothetical protein
MLTLAHVREIMTSAIRERRRVRDEFFAMNDEGTVREMDEILTDRELLVKYDADLESMAGRGFDGTHIFGEDRVLRAMRRRPSWRGLVTTIVTTTNNFEGLYVSWRCLSADDAADFSRHLHAIYETAAKERDARLAAENAKYEMECERFMADTVLMKQYDDMILAAAGRGDTFCDIKCPDEHVRPLLMRYDEIFDCDVQSDVVCVSWRNTMRRTYYD